MGIIELVQQGGWLMAPIGALSVVVLEVDDEEDLARHGLFVGELHAAVHLHARLEAGKLPKVELRLAERVVHREAVKVPALDVHRRRYDVVEAAVPRELFIPLRIELLVHDLALAGYLYKGRQPQERQGFLEARENFEDK